MIGASGPDWFARGVAAAAFAVSAANFLLGRRDAGRARRAKGLDGLRANLRALLEVLEARDGPAMASMVLSSVRNEVHVEAIGDRAPGVGDRQLRLALEAVPALIDAARGPRPTPDEAYDGVRPRADVEQLAADQALARAAVRKAIDRIDKLDRRSPR